MSIVPTKNELLLEPSPFNMSPFKAMMWYFVVGDLLAFAGFMIAMGLHRFSEASWPNPHKVFASFPFLDGIHLPLALASVMTFLLMISSLTMLFATHASQQQQKVATAKWLLWTIVIGFVFLLAQAWEWTHLYHEGAWWGRNPFANADGLVSPTPFTDYFFIITGFHGLHVVIGLLLNIIGFINLMRGSYERSGKWGYIENVGIFWHFVDFIWVFVFTIIYLL